MQLSRHFYDSEFRNSSDMKMDVILIDKLQALRDIVGHPMTISSGVRTEAENSAAGGSKNSMHLTGKAVDISISGWSGEKKFKFLKAAFGIGFSGIAQGKTFIHLDVRGGSPSTWTY